MNKNKMIILVAIIMVIMLYPKNAWATQSYSNEKCASVLDIDVTGERQTDGNGNYTGYKITVKGNKDANIKYKIVKIKGKHFIKIFMFSLNFKIIIFHI